MIIIKYEDSGEEEIVNPTIFPDGTSQVWNLEKFDNQILVNKFIQIDWRYHNISEFFHVVQLIDLIRSKDLSSNIELYIPYFPFARQDKSINNSSCFALRSFIRLFTDLHINKLTTYDMHNDIFDEFLMNGIEIENIIPTFDLPKESVVIFPDAGAKKRYPSIQNQSITFNKKRLEFSGEIIESYLTTESELKLNNLPKDTHFVIIDDICDGGATFIRIAKVMTDLDFDNIDLQVSHGLFTKGRQILRDAGIKNIETTNSLEKNQESK